MATARDVSNNVGENLALRNALLATAPRMRKKLGSFSATQGNTTRVKLFNVGVIQKLVGVVTASVTIAGNALVAGKRGAHALLSQVKVVDFEGTDRVNASGYQLWVLNSVRNRTPAFLNNESMTAVSSMPTVPTAVGTANIQYYFEIPIAYDPERDLRGAILAQTAVGEMFVNLTVGTLLTDGSDEGVYNSKGAAGTLTVNSINIDLYQDYLFPQAIGGQLPLPMQDLLTVYEINGNFRLTDNISNGQERLIPYPNVRSVLASYTNWMNAGAMSNAINKFTLIANGNNILTENSLDTQLMEQRNWFNGDLQIGTFFYNHRNRPVETAMYGNVQAGITFNAAPSCVYYIEQMFESFYPKGALLPGMTNG